MKNENEDQGKWMVLQKAVKRLHFGNHEEKEEAVKEITKLAKENLKRRKLMAELGVIQPLVAMVGSEIMDHRRLGIQALIELANGTFTNKVVMVETGILSKLPETTKDFLDEQTKQEYAHLLLSISSLANHGYPLPSSRIIPLLLSILDTSTSIETINSCLHTLHNLSLVFENAANLATSVVITALLRGSEKALEALGNLVVTMTGKKALESNQMVPERLIEIMACEESPKCQELSAYILMILAHQSSVQRNKMEKAGIVHVLLELALLGSPLAQKRALKLLQWFKDERQVRVGPHSGPQVGRMMSIGSIGSPEVNRKEVKEGKKLMKNIVKQSLYKNLERITHRANGDTSRIKALAASSSSKSLPY